MNRDVFWTARARNDVSAIIGHIARNEPKAAERGAARIFDAGALLGQGVPGRSSRMADGCERAARGLPHILAYDIVDGPAREQRIVTLHVVHGARHRLPDRSPPV